MIAGDMALPVVRHHLAGIMALLAGLGALLAAGHVATLLALVSACFARLLANLAHFFGQWRVVFHQSHASPAGLNAGQAMLLTSRWLRATILPHEFNFDKDSFSP